MLSQRGSVSAGVSGGGSGVFSGGTPRSPRSLRGDNKRGLDNDVCLLEGKFRLKAGLAV
jgi:hypothetical protein